MSDHEEAQTSHCSTQRTGASHNGSKGAPDRLDWPVGQILDWKDKVSFSDIDIRLRLLEKLRGELPRDAVVFEEIGLRQGEARPDIVVVNGALHGYEIKSDRDTLRRLANQVEVYGSVLDLATIVTGDRHLEAAIDQVPSWWGVIRVSSCKGTIHLQDHRPGSRNPLQDPFAIAQLLWRDEALKALEERNLAVGIRSKPRGVLWRKLVEVIGIDDLRAISRQALMSRHGWRSPSSSLQ